MRGIVEGCRPGFVDEKLGWNRVGFCVSVAIITFAVVVLSRMLRELDVRAVQDALREIPLSRVVFAGLFVALGYVTLTFYDWFALRTIGRRDVPYRVAALAGFTSYSIGHNLGASAFSGGAVRYRIYSAWNLSAAEVANVILIAGLTFWLGNATVLGLGVAYVPEVASAINLLPRWFNRALAFLGLIALAGYVFWVWQKPRLIGPRGWQATLPSGQLTVLQIVIGIADLSFCAAAMYTLMPNQPPIGFIELEMIFVFATLLRFASHSPGELGVFDAAMLIALGQFGREHLIASLLIFRLLYYIMPFMLALLILGLRELWLNLAKPTPASPCRGGPTPSWMVKVFKEPHNVGLHSECHAASLPSSGMGRRSLLGGQLFAASRPDRF